MYAKINMSTELRICLCAKLPCSPTLLPIFHHHSSHHLQPASLWDRAMSVSLGPGHEAGNIEAPRLFMPTSPGPSARDQQRHRGSHARIQLISASQQSVLMPENGMNNSDLERGRERERGERETERERERERAGASI